MVGKSEKKCAFSNHLFSFVSAPYDTQNFVWFPVERIYVWNLSLSTNKQQPKFLMFCLFSLKCFFTLTAYLLHTYLHSYCNRFVFFLIYLKSI